LFGDDCVWPNCPQNNIVVASNGGKIAFRDRMVYKYAMARTPKANLQINRSITTQDRSRLRGRPREFVRADALEKAMRIFWKLGYEATSMADLRVAMGLTQASIYAAFRSKEELFLEAVNLYRASVGANTERALNDQPTAKGSVQVMLNEAASSFTSGDSPPGCLVVLGTMNCSLASKHVQNHLRRLRLQTPKAILKRLKRGQVEGDVPDGAPIEALAEYYTTVLHGLSIQSRDGADYPTLSNVARCAMVTWDTMTSQEPEH
jgi:AcrR family transcriptional regulator